VLTKERQRLALFVTSGHPTLSCALPARPLSVDVSSVFPNLSRLSKIIQMRERWCEHAEQHLTISNMLLPHLSYVTAGVAAAHLVLQRIPGLGIAARFVHVPP